METRYGGRSPPQSYQKKHRSSSFTPLKTSRLRSRLVVYTTAIIFASLIITYGLPIQLSGLYPQALSEISRTQSTHARSNETGLVPLEAHVMSKCPDAKTCLEELVVPTMERVVDLVNFRLSYIGSVDDNDTLRTYLVLIRGTCPGDPVTRNNADSGHSKDCMHGQTECLGNMLSLCANNLFPNNVKISLGFSTCLIMSYQRIPSRDLVQSCALERTFISETILSI